MVNLLLTLLTDIQFKNINDVTALRSPRNAQIETVKLSDSQGGGTETVTIVGGLAFDANNNSINLGSGKYAGSLILGKETAYASALDAQRKSQARQEINLTQGGIKAASVGKQIEEGVKLKDGTTFVEGSPRQAELVVNMVEKIQNGSGPYANLKVLFNSAMSLSPSSWGWQDVFMKQVDAQNWMTAINITSRVALANSPRVAEGEQQRLGRITVPDPKQFFTNPRAALAKTMVLKQFLRKEKLTNLKLLSTSSDKMLIREATRQNASIDTFMDLLQDVPEYGFLDDDALNELEERINLPRD